MRLSPFITTAILFTVILAGSGCVTGGSGEAPRESGMVYVYSMVDDLSAELPRHRYRVVVTTDNEQLESFLNRQAHKQLGELLDVTMEVPFSGNIVIHYLSAAYNDMLKRPEGSIAADNEGFEVGFNFNLDWLKKKKKTDINDGEMILTVMNLKGRKLWTATCRISAGKEGSTSAAETAKMCLAKIARRLAKDIK